MTKARASSSSKFDIRGYKRMRIYEPNPKNKVVRDVLQKLYLLRQAIDHDSVAKNIKLSMLDKIADMIKQMEEA